jgi:hypothetical protein
LVAFRWTLTATYEKRHMYQLLAYMLGNTRTKTITNEVLELSNINHGT